MKKINLMLIILFLSITKIYSQNIMFNSLSIKCSDGNYGMFNTVDDSPSELDLNNKTFIINSPRIFNLRFDKLNVVETSKVKMYYGDMYDEKNVIIYVQIELYSNDIVLAKFHYINGIYFGNEFILKGFKLK